MKSNIILRLGLAAAFILCGGTAVHAQYSKLTYDSPCIAKLVQVDQYDESTVFMFTVSSPEGRERFSVNDNIKIMVDGSYKTYRLLNVANIPLSSENCVAYLKKKGDALNFIMEFEKVPLDKPFSIVENPDRHSALTFNFDNVTVDTGAAGDKVDLDDFLSYTDYIRSGKYTQDGGEYMFYEVNGLSVATHLRDEMYGLTKVGILNVVVTNDSGRTVNFSDANIRVTAIKNERKGYVEIPLWNVQSYDSFVRSNNAMALDDYAEAVNPVASSIANYRRSRAKDDLGSDILLGSLELIIRSTNREKVDEYAAALEENRRRLWDNYIQSVSMGPGEVYGGFVSFKDASYKHYVITVTIGGREYTFNING